MIVIATSRRARISKTSFALLNHVTVHHLGRMFMMSDSQVGGVAKTVATCILNSILKKFVNKEEHVSAVFPTIIGGKSAKNVIVAIEITEHSLDVYR